MCVCACVLTWTVCHLLVGLFLAAASTQVEDTFISLQAKWRVTMNEMTENGECENEDEKLKILRRRFQERRCSSDDNIWTHM